MQNWFFDLKRIGHTSLEKLPLKGIVRHSWTLLCVPVIVYMRPWLDMLFGFYGAYAFLCLLPGFLTLIAFGLYRTERGSLGPVILGLLCSLGFGATFTYSVAMQVVVPILPRNILEVFNFIERLEPLWPLIASSSLLSSLFIISHLIKYGLTHQKKVKQENSHGSARFATSQEIKALHHEEGIPIGCLIKGELSTDIDQLRKQVAGHASQEIIKLNPHHMVLVAPSGAGKGVGIIIPTLLDYDGPVLVTDVKAAENFHVTARHRASLGREVYVLDPFKKTGQESGCINILDHLDPNSEEVVDDAAMIASLLVPIPSSIKSKETHFYERARATIQGLILYVVCSEFISREEKTLFQVYKLTCQSQSAFRETLTQIESQDNIAYGVPSRIAASLLTTALEEISGILNTVKNELAFFDSPLMQKITAKTTIDLNKLIQNRADLYLCIPVDKLDSYGRIIRLIISIVFNVAQRHENKSKKPVLMVLDEMSLLGYIQKIEDALIVGRGYGVKILAVTQTLELIQSLYSTKWETFLSSHLLVFFGVNDLKGSQYVSKLLGQSTIESFSRNKSESQQKGELRSTKSSENQGESQSYQGRAILTPDEVRFMNEDTVLAFCKGIRPMVFKKVKYYQHPEWKGKYDPNPLES